MENEKKRKLFSFSKTEKPDLGPEDTTPTLKFFFKLLWRKIGKLMTLNIMMMPQYLLLIIAALIFFLGNNKVATTEYALYAPLLGISIAGGSPTANLLLGIFSRQLDMPFLTPGRTVVIVILIALTVVTWGWQNVGAAYNLRSLIRGDSCFLLSDYFYAIRRNLKQGFFFGLLDAIVLIVLGVDLFYFNALSGQGFFLGFMFIMIIAIALIYMVMRFYIYYMMITFELSIKKLLKNALIFVTLGIKRNLMALLGIALVVGLNIVFVILGLQVGFTLPLILPVFYLPALSAFMAGYAAWPIIQRYMIDPYVDHTQSDTFETEPEAVSDLEQTAEEEATLPPPTAD
ncbi:MAG: hypothetical protein E7585_00335 [Ruminococcaceae bacterium]|nr:hypothetical protein [Oscillospiraceae bacterium]